MMVTYVMSTTQSWLGYIGDDDSGEVWKDGLVVIAVRGRREPASRFELKVMLAHQAANL